MGEKIIEISELEKTLTGFQRIPKGDVNTAYVFFQSGNNTKYVISTERRKVMTAELRLGKYDRIMTIHRGEFTETFQGEIACKENGHNFSTSVDIRYFITDPETIYLKRIHEVSRELSRSLSETEDELDQCYGFRECAAISRDMKRLLAEKLAKLSYLECSFQLKVVADESANTIIKREQDHEIAGKDADLSAVEEQIKVQNSYDLEQLRLEREKKTAQLNAEVQSIKMEHLGGLIRRYGINAGRMIEHIDGGMNGAQLSDALEKSLHDNRSENLNMILKLYNEGIMSKEIAEQSFVALLGAEEGKNIAGLLEKVKAEPQNEPEIKADTFQWNNSDIEDGTIE